MYKDIQRNENGQLIWVFLKPLLLGKIPYSPNTPVTRAIMAKAAGIFDEVGKIREFAQMWIDNMENMQSLSNSSEAVETIQVINSG